MESSGLALYQPPTKKMMHRRNNFDWISEPRPENLTSFQNFMVNLDWTKSPLGPMNLWPSQLRQMVLLVIADPTPAVVYWGEEATIIYNEAYVGLVQKKHPALQGQDPKIHFAEFWTHFENLLSNQRETGRTVVEEDAAVMIQRRGFLEEGYFSWKFVPIVGNEGFIVGSHATVIETTSKTISERRASTIQLLSTQVSEAKTIEEVWSNMMQGLKSAEKEIPMALLYSVSEYRPLNHNPTILEPLSCNLEEAIGVPDGHLLAPTAVKIMDGNDSWLSLLFRKVGYSHQPLFEPIPEDVKAAFSSLEWRGLSVTPSSVVVCPIRPTTSTQCLAFLVIVLSPVRPYNEDYQQFITLLTEQVTTPQVSTILLKKEVERRLYEAQQEAVDKARISRQLSDAEEKFTRFAARAPIGLAILEESGFALSANELWRELTMLEVGANQMDWRMVLVEGEFEKVTGAWSQLITSKESVSVQTAVRRPWRAPDLDLYGNPQYTDTHLLLNLYADLDECGNVKSVMSCIADISELKWKEAQLRNRMNEAITMQQQQEKFIDMTSHEMRNPLSALIGCADEIITALNSYWSLVGPNQTNHQIPAGLGISSEVANPVQPPQLLSDALEAAETIIYCAMHQKRIIDDILTLSRLDSDLLVICPEPSEPVQLIRTALKMFEAELKSADTTLDFNELDSLGLLRVRWTLLDPSRVLQVFINLMTNAIKFTRTQSLRRIEVSIGATSISPLELHHGIEYIPKSRTNKDQTIGSEWGDGEIIYLTISVKDTGRGLEEEERENLFRLFQQASPKTHVQYGGSGLGLFISRQLAEMQGGQIGVASEAGKGSTFEFYIKTRKTDPSKDNSTKTDFQLLIRQDALREACGVEITALQNAMQMPNVEVQAVTNSSVSQGQKPDTGLYILVVEDNLVNQKVVSKQLRNAGHVVNVANHGEEALEFIRESKYWENKENGYSLSVVLMDLEMPVMDGIACVKRIRELQEKGDIKGHVPVIAVTANARKDQISSTLEAGMDDVITKPYRILDMLQQIQELVAKHR